MLKLIFDRVMAAAGLLALWLAGRGGAVLIKVRMREYPVIFGQRRVGREAGSSRCASSLHDRGTRRQLGVGGRESRITPWARAAALQAFSDELLELWNTSRSAVAGLVVRPGVPGYADRLTGRPRRVLKAATGITGWHQRKYASEEEMRTRRRPQQYNDEVFPRQGEDKYFHYRSHSSLWRHRHNLPLILRRRPPPIFRPSRAPTSTAPYELRCERSGFCLCLAA